MYVRAYVIHTYVCMYVCMYVCISLNQDSESPDTWARTMLSNRCSLETPATRHPRGAPGSRSLRQPLPGTSGNAI